MPVVVQVLITVPTLALPIRMPVPVMIAVIRVHDIRVRIHITVSRIGAIIRRWVFAREAHVRSAIARSFASRHTQQKPGSGAGQY
jgi:hypothetical protein